MIDTLINIFKNQEKISDRQLLSESNSDRDLTCEIGVFINHRDVKVALEELQEAGFSLSEITLITRRWRDDWLRGVNVCQSFQAEFFGSNETAQNFFQKLFKRGKYLLLLTGETKEMNSAGSIMGRRQAHADVWQF